MTINKARELLGEEVILLTDEEINRDIETARFLADVLIDKILSISSEEQKNIQEI